MKRFAVIVALFVSGFTSLSAQEAPIKTIALADDGNGIFFHQSTGLAIVQSAKEYVGIHPISGEVAWRVPRRGLAALDTEGEGGADFFDLRGTPFSYIGGSIVDAVSGQIVIDGQVNEVRYFNTYYLLPEQELILIQLEVKAYTKLFAVHPFTHEVKWAVSLRELSGLAQFMEGVETTNGSGNSTAYVIPPVLTATGDLLYHNENYLACIDLTNGELRWNEKVNPGYIFPNADASKLLVAETRTGLAASLDMGLATTGVPDKFDKTIHLLDANTGEELWAKNVKMAGDVLIALPYDNGFLLVHDEGMNIYDFTPGREPEGRWRKGFDQKGIKNVVIEDEGFMVYFRNKRTLVDPATGEEVWDRPERLEREPPSYSTAAPTPDRLVGNYIITQQGNNLRLKENSGSRFPVTVLLEFDQYIIDEANERVIIIDDITSSGSSSFSYVLSGFDLAAKGELPKERLDLRFKLLAFDATDNGYFFYGDRGFVIYELGDGVWNKGADRYFPLPTGNETQIGGKTFIKSGYYGQAQNMHNSAVVGGNSEAEEAYFQRMNAKSEAEGIPVAGRVAQDYAYFFSTNDNTDQALFRIRKSDGAEVSKIPFEDRNPLYEIDAVNKRLYYVKDETLKIYSLE